MKIFRALLPAVLAASGAAAAVSSPLPLQDLEAAGVSPARLARLHEFLQREIDAGHYLGAVELIARRGAIVDWQAYGFRDLARQSPMQRDSIFRLYSMTKPMATVALLTLMEEGRFVLDDPIAKFLPEFANMQVCVGGTAAAPMLRPAVRPITIHHLLTHTAGFATTSKDAPAAREIYGRYDLHQCPDFASYCERLSHLPLGADPGERFAYDGVNIEVSCRLVEVLSGTSFEAFIQQRVLGPLGLADTGFAVAPEKRARIADLTTVGSDGRLVLSREKTAQHPGERLQAYASGAGGLYSSAGDYVRFCQMLLNGGELNGVSILGRKTVELMMMNHLTLLTPAAPQFRPGDGFGLGGSVRVDVALKGQPGSAGQFGWSGAASTYFTIDPHEQLIAILLLQQIPTRHHISDPFYNLVFQSLTK